MTLETEEVTTAQDEWREPITLDHELMDHLAVEESVFRLWDQKFEEKYLLSDEALAKSILAYQFDHLKQYGYTATSDTLEFAFPDIAFAPPTTNIDWLIDEFRKRYVKKTAKDTAFEAAKQVAKDPAAGIDYAIAAFGELKNATRKESISIRTIDYKEILDDFFSDDDKDVVSWGFEEINKKLIGLKKGHFYTVIGRPKRHKSWMLLAQGVGAQAQGKRAVLFELEMPGKEMFYRYACYVTGISWNKFYHKQLMPKEKKELYATLEYLSSNESPFTILSPPMGERRVCDLKALAKEHKADVVLVDQMSFIKSRQSYGPRRNLEIEEICEEIKADAVNEAPWFVACQFSREGNDESLSEMADLSAIGLSDAIGQKSDVIMGLRQTKEDQKSRMFQYGVIAARSFAPVRWAMRYDLQNSTQYKVVEEDE